jgi:hypothetical protein
LLAIAIAICQQKYPISILLVDICESQHKSIYASGWLEQLTQRGICAGGRLYRRPAQINFFFRKVKYLFYIKLDKDKFYMKVIDLGSRLFTMPIVITIF